MHSSLVIVCCTLALAAASPVADSALERWAKIRSALPKHRMAEGATASPLPIDPALQECSQELYRLDQAGNAAKVNTHWAIDTRSRNGKLFTKLDKSVFQKPTYKALIALLDNYEPVLGVAETTTVQEKQEESAFLDAIMATPVMQKVYQCLKQRNLVPATTDGFKELLRTIWFKIYRRRGQPDTSGFEHAFVGELSDASTGSMTSGFHNWVQLATQEDAGKTTYKSWKGQAEPGLVGMQFAWNGHTKIKSTIAIGESPEMSIAVNTLCFLVAPNNECKLKFGNFPVSILTYKWDTRDPKESYIASAYYN